MSELISESTALCASIKAVEEAWLEKARARQLGLTKPPGSLGRLEEIGNRLSAIQQTVTPEVTQKIYEAILKGVGTPEARKGLTSRGVEPVLDTPAHFRQELEADLARWGEVTKKAKISLD